MHHPCFPSSACVIMNKSYFVLTKCNLISIFGRYYVQRNILNTSAMSSAKRFKSDDKKDRIVWVDLEMSGLDLDKDHILEMACIVTDKDLNIVAESDDLVIHQPDAVLDGMDSWCTQHHGESGLTEAVRKSNISLTEAEERMLEFIEEHTLKRHAPLGGNSVHADRGFLVKYMPRFTEHLHYRIIDTLVSLRILWRTTKKLSHRALDDIKESIEELRYYRQNVFKPT